MIDATRFRHPVEIRRATQLQNAKGGYDVVWTSVTRAYAEIVSLGGRESVMAETLQGVEVYRITLRWRAGVMPEDQIRLLGGRDLNIRSAEDPTGKRELLVIVADNSSVRAET